MLKLQLLVNFYIYIYIHVCVCVCVCIFFLTEVFLFICITGRVWGSCLFLAEPYTLWDLIVCFFFNLLIGENLLYNVLVSAIQQRESTIIIHIFSLS